MHPFIEGFTKGAKETPRGFFAPVIACWHLFVRMIEITDELVSAASKKMPK